MTILPEKHHGIMFLRKLFRDRFDSTHLISLFSLNVPDRRTRYTNVFHEPFGRVNTVKRNMFRRIPRLCNQFLRESHSVDFFTSDPTFRSKSLLFAVSQGSFMDGDYG